MPDLRAILTIEAGDLCVDILTDPPQSALFRIGLVRAMLDGRTNVGLRRQDAAPEALLVKHRLDRADRWSKRRRHSR